MSANKVLREYPYNLFDDIFQGESYIVPDDFEEALKIIVLRRYSIRGFDVLMKYYKEHKAIEEIANEMKYPIPSAEYRRARAVMCLREPFIRRQLQGGVAATTRKTDGSFTLRRNSRIRARQGNKCIVCGWAESTLDVHHVQPLSKGGADEEYNLVALCPNCHRLAHRGKLDLTEFNELSGIA